MSEARDPTHNLMVSSWIRFRCTTKGTPAVLTFGSALLFFVFLPFSRAVPAAYGDSQARGLIGAVAASLRHSNAGSKPSLRPTPQLTATLDH